MRGKHDPANDRFGTLSVVERTTASATAEA